MLPLSPGEFMRPFLLTFTLIFVIHKHELLNLILLRIQLNTPFDICPLCDDIRQQTSYSNVHSKNTQPKRRINNLILLNIYTFSTSEVLIFNNLKIFIIFFIYTHYIYIILYKFIPIAYTLEVDYYLIPTYYIILYI